MTFSATSTILFIIRHRHTQLCTEFKTYSSTLIFCCRTHSNLNEKQDEPQGDVTDETSGFEIQQPEQDSAFNLERNEEMKEAAVRGRLRPIPADYK